MVVAGQSTSLGVMFRPAATGQHSASLSVSSVSVRGDMNMNPGILQTPVTVLLQGSASLKTVESGTKPKNIVPAKRLGSGTVSLEKEVVVFPTVKVGELSIAKVRVYCYYNKKNDLNLLI